MMYYFLLSFYAFGLNQPVYEYMVDGRKDNESNYVLSTDMKVEQLLTKEECYKIEDYYNREIGKRMKMYYAQGYSKVTMGCVPVKF